ncbi:MAG: flagellar basal-body rod protein FlgG [Desulfobacterales bacterium]|nr:flagellar basal-body rod protein FlgG [Desulfobacterales bacterium]
MIRSLWSAATGMSAQSLNIDVIANNLANLKTIGFKKSRADFQDLLYETMTPAGAPTSSETEAPVGIQVGHGTRPVAVQKVFTQGDYEHTKGELDLAIDGDGFFEVTQPNGNPAYTRAGSFKLDSSGQMVTSEGFLLSPGITIPPEALAISIGVDGTVSVLNAGEDEATEVGQITMARFANPTGLHALGRNLLVPSTASGPATTGVGGEDGFGTISQGFLEMSNVSVIDEMVSMITAQRAYEINSKVIQTSDDMLQTANNLKR